MAESKNVEKRDKKGIERGNRRSIYMM